MTSKDDLYIILEVGRTAPVNEIKRAFRRLARRYHPDINPGDRHAEERFKRITEAYDILSDPLKRQFYDMNGFYSDGVLEPNGSAAGWGFSFQGFDFSRSGSSEFGDIFRQVFANRPERRNPERGGDLEHQVSMKFDESIRGRRMKRCVPAAGWSGTITTVRCRGSRCGRRWNSCPLRKRSITWRGRRWRFCKRRRRVPALLE